MSSGFQPVLALGLMSGTSADGVDAALLRTDGEHRIDFLDAITVPYRSSLRSELLAAAQTDVPLLDLLRLEKTLTHAHVETCQALLDRNLTLADQLHVIGFHGHTIRHDPGMGVTWQLGDAALLSSRLGTRVVHDFRRADIAMGGQGAPLAPLFHAHVLQAVEKPTMVLNLGGVANITWLGDQGEIRAGDTGPGCGLLDAWAQKRIGLAFDRDGQLAAAGKVHAELVQSVLTHEYFQRELPKSADRFEFDFVDVDALTAEDGAATLCAITATAVSAAARRLPAPPGHCWVTGGGSRHSVLMDMLREQLGHAEPIEALGLSSEFLEAQCFGWLAVRRLRGFATSWPETTGCNRPTSGGSVTEPAEG